MSQDQKCLLKEMNPVVGKSSPLSAVNAFSVLSRREAAYHPVIRAQMFRCFRKLAACLICKSDSVWNNSSNM